MRGFEPLNGGTKNPLPYRLATSQQIAETNYIQTYLLLQVKIFKKFNFLLQYLLWAAYALPC